MRAFDVKEEMALAMRMRNEGAIKMKKRRSTEAAVKYGYRFAHDPNFSLLPSSRHSCISAQFPGAALWIVS
jgi:hypothetical protein